MAEGILEGLAARLCNGPCCSLLKKRLLFFVRSSPVPIRKSTVLARANGTMRGCDADSGQVPHACGSNDFLCILGDVRLPSGGSNCLDHGSSLGTKVPRDDELSQRSTWFCQVNN